jgi:hypothetical protein
MELSTAAAASLPIVEITRLCESVCTEQSPSDFAGSLKDPEDDRHQQFSVGHNKSDASVITRPVSLKRLLSSQSRLASKRDPYLSTSAKQRYGIAASIAWSVLHLGGSSWLCHRWEEEQTAIFVEKESGERERLSPYPCTSFDFSCTTSPAESPTDDINDFIPNRTVCALGVLLVELCMNKTMAELNDAPLDEASTTFLDDFKTARNNLNEVYNLAGDLYGNAAKRCLIFSFEGRDDHNDFDFSQFRQQFYDTVVAPLQATYHIFAQTHIP